MMLSMLASGTMMPMRGCWLPSGSSMRATESRLHRTGQHQDEASTA
jgi:hypothetical protein